MVIWEDALKEGAIFLFIMKMPNRMSKNNLTIYQRLEKAVSGKWNDSQPISSKGNVYNVSDANRVIFRTNNKEEYEAKKVELAQDKYLHKQWVVTNHNLDTVQAFKGKNNLLLMYTDADFMDSAPEIAAALDGYAEESCVLSDTGHVIMVKSESNRIKSIIEDLLYNRLDTNILAPMVIRSMAKYGNQYMLLDIDRKNGVKGWRQLPVAEMERIENGVDSNMIGMAPVNMTVGKDGLVKHDNTTKFRWTGYGQNGIAEFRNWQVAHFRLITNSVYLPYGVSILNPARRHFRMLCLMEDMMLIYRLERSMERRVFKIFVGAMDDADIPAYMDEIANNFKRTPIVDPMTGQLDLRKNILSGSEDYFIPVRDQGTSNPIESLGGAQNLTALDDIKYVQNKVFTGLSYPKAFISFEESKGDGKNLAMMDIRFARKITRIQQAFLMELNKIVILHLYLLGFQDELNNFQLYMTNPSTQADIMNVENNQKKISAVRDAVSDPGIGMPILSMKRALSMFLNFSEKDYKDNLEEIRLEKALSKELEKTDQIIQRTGLFDRVDHIYGEPWAEYGQGQQQDGGEGGDFGGGGGGGFGGGLDSIGDMGGDAPDGDLAGEESMMPTGEIGGGAPDEGGAPQEGFFSNKPLIDETPNRDDITLKVGEGFVINTEINEMMKEVNNYLNAPKDGQERS